jgi:hypothetical protein
MTHAEANNEFECCSQESYKWLDQRQISLEKRKSRRKFCQRKSRPLLLIPVRFDSHTQIFFSNVQYSSYMPAVKKTSRSECDDLREDQGGDVGETSSMRQTLMPTDKSRENCLMSPT